MKKNLPSKMLKGATELLIAPDDPIAWKLFMLYEAATRSDMTIKDIAKKYGYTREHFYVVKNAYDVKGSIGLMDKSKGPKTNYRRTNEIKKQIIRHRFLDPEASCEVIAQKMQQAGYNISQRSVERTINEFGLQKKGYIKQIRKQRKQN
jgi:transposase